MNIKQLTRAGVTAALYALITVAISPLSYGPFQIRFSEALCILPLLFPECAIGLTVGCFIANFFGGYGAIDIVLGTTATLIGAVGTLLAGKFIKNVPLKLIVGILCPVISNTLLIPVVLLLATETPESYFVYMLSIGWPELLSVGVLGTPLYFAVKRIFKLGENNDTKGGKQADNPKDDN